MVDVCLTCGDRGIFEALTFCAKCKVYSVHLYCLPEIPDDFDDVVWLCEDCETEARKLPALDNCSPESGSLGSVQEEKNNSVRKRKRTSDINVSTGSLDMSKDPGVEKSSFLQLDSGKINKDLDYRLDDKCCMDEAIESVESVIVNETGCCNDSENLQPVITHSPDIVEQNYVPAQPIEEPIWRGHLSISGELFDGMLGLTAHLSNLACPRVCSEAKLMPLLLSPELLPRSTIWPKSFAKWGPSDDSIALYFFPDSERGERVFDALVNGMIERDLGMRAEVQNAELLIFTSRLMPMDFWRFQAKYYLWGVFKGKRSQRGVLDRRSPISPLSNGSNGFGSSFSWLPQSML